MSRRVFFHDEDLESFRGELIDDLKKSRLSYVLSRSPRCGMPHRARENTHRHHGSDDAALRSVSGATPCGRKESGDDRRRVRCSSGCHRRGGCGGAAVAESENQTTEREVRLS